jgi:integrase
LRLSDVDFKSKLLHVPGTKTETTERTIPLFENVAALLAQIKPQKPADFYFPFRPDYPTHAFKKLCPAHKLHDLRHTFATRCLAAKIPLKIVQIWLGHSEIDTTADIYTHVTNEINTAESEALNAYTRKRAL